MNTHKTKEEQIKELNDAFYKALRQKLDNAEIAENVAKERLNFLKEIGESPIELEQNITRVNQRRKRIDEALKRRGYV